ncbi:MAG: hypothetical protein M3O89_06725, partial [Actinomycetota bacterium]|nr:hypothetical protein [Actinomycetota bacterium]
MARVRGADRLARALTSHVALVGFMGAGKTMLAAEVALRIGRPFLDLDDEIERRSGSTVVELFLKSEADFRSAEEEVVCEVLERLEPHVLALGGGAVLSERTRRTLRERAITVLIPVDVGTAWRRVEGSGRPLARGLESFEELYRQRQPLYGEVADATARDADDIVLAAAGVHVERGGLGRLAELVPGDGPADLVSDPHVAGIHGMDAQLALGARLAQTHELPLGEEAKTLAAIDRLWHDLRLDRSGTIVALGGGCTTDAAGFAAATYL